MKTAIDNLRPKILKAALTLAVSVGFNRLTRSQVAKEAEVAPGSVSYHFEDMKGLQTAVMREAIDKRNLAVVAQGLIARNRIALYAPADLRAEALKSAAR